MAEERSFPVLGGEDWLAAVADTPAAWLTCVMAAAQEIPLQPWLGNWVHGALGAGLTRAGRSHPDARVRMLARKALAGHGSQPRGPSGAHFRPAVLGLPPVPRITPAEPLFVEISLFGAWAELWRAYVAAAAVLTLDLPSGAVRLERVGALVRTAGGFVDPAELARSAPAVLTLGKLAESLIPPPGPVRLSLLSPTVLTFEKRRVQELSTAEPLLVAAVSALKGVAGVETVRQDYQQWRRLAAGVRVQRCSLRAAEPVRCEQGLAYGVSGEVEFADLPAPLGELFALAYFTHLGSRAHIGLGGFALEALGED